MKAFYALAVGLLFVCPAFAQPPDKLNEAFVSVGDASLIFSATDPVGDFFKSIGVVTYSDPESPYQIVGGYHRDLGRWASAGVSTSWAHATRTMYVWSSNSGKVDRQMLTFMAEGNVHWLRNPMVELYSGLALGVALVKDRVDEGGAASTESSRSYAAYQVTLGGVRVGRDLGLFLEAGTGYSSILKLGLSGRW
jgi:hypothetical protein